MPNDPVRRAATVIAPAAGQTGAEKIAAEPGIPGDPVYLLTSDTFDLYKFVEGNTDTADGYNVIAPTGGTTGRYKRVVPGGSPLGSDLIDADATISIADGKRRILPVSTLTAARTLTLSTAGAQPGDVISVTRLDQEAFTYQVNNGFDDSAILILAASVAQWAACLYKSDAVGWIQVEAGPLL